MIVLENAGIKLVLNQRTGGIISVQNKIKRVTLCRARGKIPWRLQIEDKKGDTEWITKHKKFECERKGEGAILKWTAKASITVEARIDLPKKEENAYFYIKVNNKGNKVISGLEYPIIEGIKTLGKDPAKTRLIHPIASGYLFNNPLDLFEPEVKRKWHEDLKYELYHAFYPDGFLGVGMQFVGYYVEGKGGFYIAAHDPYKTAKYVNFYKDDANTQLICSFTHLAWDQKPSNSLVLEYPIVISPLSEGNWYEAADKYREWAIRQEWCKKGPLWERVRKGKASKWLLENIGFCTFGISSAVDQAEWYDAFHKITGNPVFHITAWDWAGPHDRNYDGKESWFPAAFNPRNLETIKKNGDYFAPFEFDLFYNREHPNWKKVKKFAIAPSREQLRKRAERLVKIMKSMANIPEQFKSKQQELEDLLNQPKVEFSEEWRDLLSPFSHHHKNMCPVTKFWQEFHKWRDEMVVEKYGADANYYDISANNGEGGEMGGPTSCYSTSHSHPKGSGRWMINAYRKMYQATKDATSRAKGQYVPQGTEVITEVFIDCIDFYQARAEAGPCGTFEGEPFKKWEIEGKCEKVPLFAYVYHDYGPVRLDGWGKLSKAFGDIFYWIASRVILWGGIFELNYEFSPLERFPGMKGPTGYITYGGEWRVDNNPHEVDLPKLDFLKEITAARTGFAKDYLAYGQMVRPLQIEAPAISINYFYYNVPGGNGKNREIGRFTTKSVLHSAWMFKKDKLGLLFVNLQDKELDINVKVNPKTYRLVAKTGYTSYYVTAEKTRKIASFKTRMRKKIRLPPKKIVLIEIKPQ